MFLILNSGKDLTFSNNNYDKNGEKQKCNVFNVCLLLFIFMIRYSCNILKK